MPTSLKSIFQAGSSGVGGGHLVAPTSVQDTVSYGDAQLGKYSALGIDASTGVTVLSLSGKFAIHGLSVANVASDTNNTTQIRLTIDGVDIFNQFIEFTNPQVYNYTIWGGGSGGAVEINNSLCPLICEQSLEVFVYNTSATNVNVGGIFVALPD